jgi:hypothetical protein
MYSKIKQLRHRGVRRSDRDISADFGVEGYLTLALCGGMYELKLHAHDDTRQEPIVPILYDAKLISMHGNKMLFQGLERHGDEKGPQFAQAWSVMVMVEPQRRVA